MLLIIMMFMKSNALQDCYFQFKGSSKSSEKKTHTKYLIIYSKSILKILESDWNMY